MIAPTGNTRAALGGFLLLFVASRLLYLVLIDPGYLPGWLGQELYRGAIAQELVTGLKMPFTEYRADNYSGGSLVIGALASGFFLLFGPTLFALKLAPLLVLSLALGFVVGFSPWILFNVQTHFAGLVIYDKNVWEHFGLEPLLDGLAHPRQLAPYEFFANLASDDPRDLPRRAVNLLYSLLYLGPILTAGVLRLKMGRSDPAGVNDRGRGPRVSTREAGTRPSRTHPTQPTLVGFVILYLVVFALAVQFSDFKSAYYDLPIYPFLFSLTAHSLARCQDAFPLVQKKIGTVFLASLVLAGLGTHAPLLSLDRPGFALSAKGYSYARMPFRYLRTHAPAGLA